MAEMWIFAAIWPDLGRTGAFFREPHATIGFRRRRERRINGVAGLMLALDAKRAIVRTILAPLAAVAVIGAATDLARAQQYFNGAQTTPNAAINGGNGVWNTTTTNWTDATGATSAPYDPTAATTLFGSSGPPTPGTGGTVTVGPGGVQLTGLVQFQATGDNSIYTIQGGSLTVAAGGTMFAVDNVSGSVDPSAVISSAIVGNDGISACRVQARWS